MEELSIVIPAYNERDTIPEILKRVKAAPLPIARRIILVDDGSTDGGVEAVAEDADVAVIRLPRNRGKGAALRAGFAAAKGEFVLIQDADLEYDPRDYPVLLAPLLDGRADVVFGSRFLGGPHRVLLFWHYAANKFFTLLANMLYNVNLNDMGTGYKAFRRSALSGVAFKSDGFGFEAEFTAKVCKLGLRLYEVPISYSGRTHAEGKKITWRDGFAYLACLLRYRVCD